MQADVELAGGVVTTSQGRHSVGLRPLHRSALRQVERPDPAAPPPRIGRSEIPDELAPCVGGSPYLPTKMRFPAPMMRSLASLRG